MQVVGWTVQRQRAGLLAAYVLALALGRAARTDASELALAWPAAGVGAAWLAWSWGRRWQTSLDVTLVAALTAAGNALTGAPPALCVAYGLASAIQALVACALWRRRRPTWQLLRLPDLTALVIASVGASLASALVGASAAAARGHLPLAPTLALWTTRNAVSTLVIAGLLLRLLPRPRPSSDDVIRGPARHAELGGILVLVAGAYALSIASGAPYALVLVVLPLSVWAAMRLPTTTALALAALNIVGVALVSVLAAMPLVRGSATSRQLVIQGFLAVVVVLTLSLSLHRDERAGLIARLAVLTEQARAQAALLGSVLTAATEQAILATDLQGRLTVINEGARRLLGPPAALATGQPVQALLDPTELAHRAAERGVATSLEALVSQARAGVAETRQWSVTDSIGRRRQVRLTVTAIRDDAAQVTGFTGVATDVTEQQLAETALADSEQRFRMAFATAPTGLCLLSADPADRGLVTGANPAMTRFLGRDVQGTQLLDACLPDDAPALAADLAQAAAVGDLAPVERRFVHRDGGLIWAQCSAAVVRPTGAADYLMLLVSDVTDRRAAEEALRHQALHDPLTGLANRTKLRERLAEAAAPAGLVYLDLDGFKAVNDLIGHDGGDQLLLAVSARLLAAVRPGDTVARLGGDEFAVVCPDIDADRLDDVAQRLVETVRRPYVLLGQVVEITTSVGTSMTDGTVTAGELLRQADDAMYRAKRSGKDRVAAAGVSRRQERTLLTDLRHALDEGQLVLHGQPIVDLDTGRVLGVETVLRWQHPQRGVLPGAAFLSAQALRTSQGAAFLAEIGLYALSESVRMAASWVERLGHQAPAVYLDVVPAHLASGRLLSDTLAALHRYDLPSTRLVLELAETDLATLTEPGDAELAALRAHGVRLALDQLSGAAGLASLVARPADVLKLDGAVVRDVGASSEPLIRAVRGLARTFGTTVIATGVDTPAQAASLRRWDIDSAQGHLWSGPRPEAELAELCTAGLAPISAPRIPSRRRADDGYGADPTMR